MNKGLIFVALIAWCGASSWYYDCKVKCVCEDQPAQTEPAAEVSSDHSYSISFHFNSIEPVKGKGYDAVIDSMKACINNGGTLIITGLSAKQENKVPSNSGAGSRAKAIGDLLTGIGNKKQIEYKHEYVNAWADTVLFPAYRWICKEKEVVASVVESLSGATIYFPSGSEQKLNNAEVDTYLQKLAGKLKAKSGKIKIIGHSDEIGDDRDNYSLALKRAEAVRSLLITLGVNASSIQIESKGEKSPIADNKTDDGRARNRRAEIIIL